MFHNVCRLCLGTEDLIWIFNEKMVDNMPEIIQVTSGVEITKSDPITQMVCSTCCQITIKMFKFRTTSIKNDKDLKAKCAGYNVAQLTNSAMYNPKKEPPLHTMAPPQTTVLPPTMAPSPTMASPQVIAPTTHISTSTVSSPNVSVVETKVNTNATPNLITPVVKPVVPKYQVPQKYRFAHPSIKQIVKEHPNIQLPEIPMSSHFGAYITLLTDEVEDWYREKNYSTSQIVEIKRAALEYAEASENSKILQTQPQRKRARKPSTEPKSLSSTKKSAIDKTVNNTINPHKRIKLNGDITVKQVKPNVDITGNSNSSPTVKTNTTSFTKSFNTVTKSGIQTTFKSEAISAVKLTSNVRPSNSTTTKPNINAVDTSYNLKTVKPNANNVVKSSVNSVTKTKEILPPNINGSITSHVKNTPELSYRTTITDTFTPSFRTRTFINTIVSNSNSTEKQNNNNKQSSSILNSLLVADKSTKGSEEITLKSMLGSTNSVETSHPAVIDSDDDDPSYDPGNDQTYDQTDASDTEVAPFDKQQPKTTEHKEPHRPQREKDVNKQQPVKNTEQPAKNNESGQTPKISKQPEPVKESKQAEPRKEDNITSARAIKQSEDFTLFTTRPFIRSAEERRKSKVKYKVRLEGYDDAELLILSDSDEDCADKNKSTNKNTENTSDVGDPIVLDADSSDGSCKSTDNRSDKNDYAKSLELAPRPTNNMPDLSLVSVTNKSFTLFICKVCDSHFSSQKDLKTHEKKTHTRCPFCNKKFRSLTSRDEHVKYTCIINNAPFELKNPKLELIRVDEMPEIRKKYASAFEHPVRTIDEMETLTAVSDVLHISSVQSEPISTPSQNRAEGTEGVKNNNTSTVDAVTELEKFLKSVPSISIGSAENTDVINTTSCTDTISHANATSVTTAVTCTTNVADTTECNMKEANVSTNETTAAESEVEAVSNNVDIICISDDEADTSSKSGNGGTNSTPKINIVNNDILRDMNLNDSDVNVLKKILTSVRSRRTDRQGVIGALINNAIIDGNTNKVKIFKNLRKHLQHFKIPVEISYDPNLTVEYKYTEAPPIRKISDLWYTMKAEDLKFRPNVSTTTWTPPSVPPISSLASHTYNISNAPLRVSGPSSTVTNNSPVLLHAQSSSTSQNVLTTTNVFQPVLTEVQGQGIISQVAQLNSVQDSTVVSSNNLVFNSYPQFMSSHNDDHNYTSAPRPLILNGTQNICSSTSNNYTNFILLSNPFITQNENVNKSELPAAQGPLPVIQSVTTAIDLEETTTIDLEEPTSSAIVTFCSTATSETEQSATLCPATGNLSVQATDSCPTATNAATQPIILCATTTSEVTEPAISCSIATSTEAESAISCPTTTNVVVQPAIRVKNLSELS